MSHQLYRESSRLNWGKPSERGQLNNDEVQLGAILRIADATEKMAQRHTELIRDRDYYEREYIEQRDRAWRAERRLSAAKGQITKLKKLITAAAPQPASKGDEG